MSLPIAVIAGEESGDARAASLLQEIAGQIPEARFFGAGGPRCAALGDSALGGFDAWIDQSAVVGLWDVLRQYPYFRSKFAELKRRILTLKPAAIIFVDYPGFNLRLASALRPLLPKTKFIYYISPQVWAWNQRRIPRMAQILDLMICLFPFETKLYEKSGLSAVFCGHPLVEELAPWKEIPRESNLLGLFPGSRNREVHRLFPNYLKALRIIHASAPEIRVEIAAARLDQATWMREQARRAGWSENEITTSVGEARSLMARATVGLVCSGTASLEAAILGLPYALTYKVNWLTYEVGRRLVRIQHLGMVNILAGETIVREYIQDNCHPFFLADEVLRLWNHPEERNHLSQRMARATTQLGTKGASGRAAQAISHLLAEAE